MTPSCLRPQRGLTLIELMVTLVIVAMVATLLGQAMAQLSRVERLLESGQLRSVAASVRAEWVRSALESLLPGSEAGEQLQGSERELRGLSGDVPGFVGSGPATLHLRVVADAATASSRLEMLGTDGQDTETAAVTLLAWPGVEGRFRYLAEDGRWLDRWPAVSTGPGIGMPRAILLDAGVPDLPVIVGVPRASQRPLHTLRQVENS